MPPSDYIYHSKPKIKPKFKPKKIGKGITQVGDDGGGWSKEQVRQQNILNHDEKREKKMKKDNKFYGHMGAPSLSKARKKTKIIGC